MTGRSLTGLFNTEQEGVTDPENRSYVLHGKERHVPGQEENLGGYPIRAIRTHDFLYIRNFQPGRWPSGTPRYREAAFPCCWLGDCDNGPTKSYMVENRELDEHHAMLYRLAFGKRPLEELYDCRKDPGQMVNLAGRPEYAEIQERLSELLGKGLKESRDPRIGGPSFDFDAVPYLGQGPRHPSCGQE